ncbi:HipA domain-containing protein, partial [Fulvivirga sp.]
MPCLSCLKENIDGYCLKCRKELFGGIKISPQLTFNSPYSVDNQVYNTHTQHISISGVQIKYSLKLVEGQLQLTDEGGEYILKPIPTGTFQQLDQAPANEHLTMQLARQVYGLNVPPNAIVYFTDNTPAYLVKRFDRKADGTKCLQEDFAQIAQMTSESHGENYKYDLSYQEMAELIKRYIPAYPIALEAFFRMILFNYLFSNGDAHVKNFSAIRSEMGDYQLTPAYDLLCTKLHSPSESDLALNLLAEGYPQKFLEVGFHTYNDFMEFGVLIGILPRRMEKILG